MVLSKMGILGGNTSDEEFYMPWCYPSIVSLIILCCLTVVPFAWMLLDMLSGLKFEDTLIGQLVEKIDEKSEKNQLLSI